MLQYRHYNNKEWDPEVRYGIALYAHPERITLDIYFGTHVFVWFRNRGAWKDWK